MNAPGIEAPRDRNRIRAAGDFLLDASGARVGQSTRVAAICTAIDLLVTRVDVRPTVDRIRERLEEHRSGIDWVTDAVPARKPAFVQAALAFAYPCNTRGVAEFAEKYVSLADVPAGSPVIALHRAVTEMAHQRAAQRLDAMLKALRCIQLHLHGRRLQRITNLDDGYDYFEHMHAAIRSAKAAS